ncbi:MAG TPA: hypothetical protein PJ982_18805 [Lacipirellulaceae bacterium]|mgnify:CR=1 FL=1|nr:hypothetical protein [Lacipirellulaceae bacterium]
MHPATWARRIAAASLVIASSALDVAPALDGAPVLAAEPVLQFDFGRTLECRDVTPLEFAELYPDDRIVQCTMRLSVSLARGSMSDVDSIRVEISDRDRRLRVFDFAPSTRLESTLGGDVEWVRTTESTSSLAASLGGELPACLGDVVAHVTPTINAAKGGREVIAEKQIRLAPQSVVVASGTIDNEHGVFFTLRPSPTTSLEGVHELTVAFIVPAAWRGDAVRVSCRANGAAKVLWIKQHKVWAEKTGGVALYLAGDLEARRAAERLARQ